MSNSIAIYPKSIRTKFVALDTNNKRNIIAEGTTVKSVVHKAQKTGKDFSIMYVPKAGQKYIF